MLATVTVFVTPISHRKKVGFKGNPDGHRLEFCLAGSNPISKGNPVAEHKPGSSRREQGTISFALRKDSRTGVSDGDCLEPGAVSSTTGVLVAGKLPPGPTQTPLGKCKLQNPRFTRNFSDRPCPQTPSKLQPGYCLITSSDGELCACRGHHFTADAPEERGRGNT